MVNYVALCYALGVLLAVAFAAYAVLFGLWWQRNHKTNTESFITARGTQELWRIGWSFYAGAVGAWVIVAPSQFASFSGIVGIVVYALASGIPILLIALLGTRITTAMPHVFSLADFCGWRFGPIAKTLVALLAVFNMSIALLAEFTTIGAIFADFVGSVSWGIILVIGLLTLCYTAYGGLAVSIATDQAQGVASMALTATLAIYVAATNKTPIPKPLPEGFGPSSAGYLAIFTLGASLISSTFFSEAVWQRVWASAGRRALYGGAAIGCSCVVLVVFLSGFGGWLAFVTGKATSDTNPNLYLMQILGDGSSANATVSNWVGVVVVLLAVVMNEGAVDSLQNGLAASISGHFLKNRPLVWTRLAVVCLNIPLVIIGIRGYAVLSLFLVANLLTCCAVVPVICGLLPRLRPFVTETGFVLGFAGGLLGVTATGIAINWVASDPAASIAAGANWAWYGNSYDWRPFLAALLASTGVMLAWCCASALARARGVRGPGVSGLLMRIPGMRWVTAEPNWQPHQRLRADSDLGLPHPAAAGVALPRDPFSAAAAAGGAGKDAASKDALAV